MSWMAPEDTHGRPKKANRALQIATYALSSILGIVTLLFPMVPIRYVIGLHFTYLYAILLIVGSVGVLYGILRPNYKTEKTFLWVLIGGWAIYDMALWATFAFRIAHPNPLLPPSYGPAIAVIIIIFFLARKYIFLRGSEKSLFKELNNVRDS